MNGERGTNVATHLKRWSMRVVAVIFGGALIASGVVAVPASASSPSLNGTVTNASGTALGGVCVSAFSASGGSGVATTVSNGTYLISGLGAGTYTVSLDPTCYGRVTSNYARQSIPSVTVTAGSTTTQNVTLALGGTVSGTVTNASGTALGGVCVIASLSSGESGFATTATNGIYSISSLGAGTYTVSLDPTCYGRVTSNYARQSIPSVTVTAGSTTTQNVTLAIEGTVSGTVTNASGAALGGVCVIASSSSGGSGFATTASKGTYSIANLAPGATTFIFDPTCTGGVISSYGGQTVSVTVTAGSTTTQNVALSLASAPGAPTIGTAVAGNASATVSWTAGSTGGRAITGYTVTTDDTTSNTTTTDACPTSTSSTSTSCTVTGLTNGDVYKFSVAAINAIGTGTFSGSLGAVTPTSGGIGGTGPTTGPTNAPPPSSSATDGSVSYGTPVSQTVLSGAVTSLSQTSDGSTETVTVPVDALPIGTTVSIYPVTDTADLNAQVPAGQSYVMSFAVTWETPSGTSPSAATPITVTITDANIKAGDTVYMLTSAGPVAVGTATVNGTVTITFSSDPTFLVTQNALAQGAIALTSTSGTVGTALALTSSGGSGSGALTYALTSAGTAGCVITADTVRATRAGTCTVTVTKAGDATYSAVSSAATTVTFTARVTLRATKVNGVVLVGQTSIVSINGTGFYNKPTIKSNDARTSAVVIHDHGNQLVVRVRVRAGAATGWHVFTITLANGRSTRVRYLVKEGFRATKVNGFVLAGHTVLVAVQGTGFYNKPTVKSNDARTTAVVIHDHGNQLVVRVMAPSGSPTGWHVFTITLANGRSTQVRYLVK